MMHGSKLLCWISICLASALSSVATASVFSGKIRPLEFNPRPSDYSRGLDASTIHPIESMNGLKYADVQKIIPADLNPNDQSGVGRRILDNSLKNAMNSSAIRNSDLGRTATRVENSMQKNVSIGSREPNSVHHEFEFAADPVQAQARIHYSGLANAQISYHANEAKMDFEMREPVHAIATDVVYNHTDVSGDRRDLMSLRWIW
jgi:hypothetical protein